MPCAATVHSPADRGDLRRAWAAAISPWKVWAEGVEWALAWDPEWGLAWDGVPAVRVAVLAVAPAARAAAVVPEEDR